jgi:acetolactate synthase-1/2/3 large subunit
MADALADGTPMVVFTGQVVTSAIGSDAFQEADVIGISRACTKWNVMVKNVAELPRRINEAFEIATSGRPGPVLVDLPKDITAGVLRKAIPTESALPTMPSAASRAALELTQKQLNASISRVAHLLNVAKKPVIYAGHGVICSENGPALLRELADKASIPVTTTLHGLGAFDELDEKSLHMLGMHGSAYANMAMQEADLIIALGGRFDDRVTGSIAKFAPRPRLLRGKDAAASSTLRSCPRTSTRSSRRPRLSRATLPPTSTCSCRISRPGRWRTGKLGSTRSTSGRGNGPFPTTSGLSALA